MDEDLGTVLVVDDDVGCLDLMASLLGEAGFAVHAVGSGEAALSAVDGTPPLAVVLDIELGGVSGYEVCHRLREQFGDALPVVFVSGKRTEAIDRVAGILIGADDYVAKPFSPDELVARVRRLVAHGKATSGIAARARANGNGHEHTLTERESEVLALLADGYSQEQVAEQLVISSSTVATHIQRILAKLGVRSRAQAIVVAYRDGLTRAGRHSLPAGSR